MERKINLLMKVVEEQDHKITALREQMRTHETAESSQTHVVKATDKGKNVVQENQPQQQSASVASLSVQQLQDMIMNSIRAQYGGPRQTFLMYSKSYIKKIDNLRMLLGYQPPRFQQFDGKGNPKQHTAHFVETCENAMIKRRPACQAVHSKLERKYFQVLIQLPKCKRPEQAGKMDDPNYCKYHWVISHLVDKCFVLKELILRLTREKKIELDLEKFGTFEPIVVQFHQEVALKDSQEKERSIEEDDEGWTVDENLEVVACHAINATKEESIPPRSLEEEEVSKDLLRFNVDDFLSFPQETKTIVINALLNSAASSSCALTITYENAKFYLKHDNIPEVVPIEIPLVNREDNLQLKSITSKEPHKSTGTFNSGKGEVSTSTTKSMILMYEKTSNPPILRYVPLSRRKKGESPFVEFPQGLKVGDIKVLKESFTRQLTKITKQETKIDPTKASLPQRQTKDGFDPKAYKLMAKAGYDFTAHTEFKSLKILEQPELSSIQKKLLREGHGIPVSRKGLGYKSPESIRITRKGKEKVVDNNYITVEEVDSMEEKEGDSQRTSAFDRIRPHVARALVFERLSMIETERKENVEDVPQSLEDGGQSTVDELKEVNLGTIEEPRPTFISASFSSEEEDKYQGIEIDQSKIDVIQKMPRPKSLHDLRSLQGRLSYIRRFISNLEMSLGALLAQEEEKGKEHALYYLSRTLVGVEAFTVHLVAKADPIKYALSRPIISGRLAKWVVLLQQYNIVYIPEKAIKGQALVDFLADHPIPLDWKLCEDLPDDEVFFTEVMEPWTMYFDASLQYDVKNEDLKLYFAYPQQLMERFDSVMLEHVPRTENKRADALVNLATALTMPDDITLNIPLCQRWIMPPILFECQEANITTSHLIDEEDWCQPTIKALPSMSWKGRVDKSSKGSACKRLWSTSRPKLPFQLRRMGYYWPKMVQDSMDYANKCEACQYHANLIHQSLETLHPTVASWSFEAWRLDLVGPITLKSSVGHSYILAATNYFSKWTEAIPLREAKKENVTNFICIHIIYRYGIPHWIVTDNGRQFSNSMIDKLCEKFKFKQYKSFIYNAVANGLIEAFNKTLCNLLKKIVSTSKKDQPSTSAFDRLKMIND
ncbi:uncharacterized protein E5676_scaffold305G00300 [Cucumis melo var. makuwa]|uniref:Integrase catalytic domain-containing protein n=1 Tax=Cucumis melo var. makuwa TaxID=1194695 RepID=A0A5D3DD54_CUCMM|nr:uncharacterized protein E5676_scaffold305G00300 [Cucumis melo var. makuwa]